MALNKITVSSLAANAVTNIAVANGTITSVDLADTGVLAGSYGNSNTAISMTVGLDGRITYIANLASTASGGSGVDAHPFFFTAIGS